MTPSLSSRAGLLALTSLGLAASGTPVLANETGYYMDLNPIASNSVLYELQVRTANACLPGVGLDWQQTLCNLKPAPKVQYRAVLDASGRPQSCGDEVNLEKIKLGTLEDLLVDTDDPKNAISLRYINEKVGANVVWLQPIFPNNDTWNIPDPCDNLGSPYAVRDYMHASGMISNNCKPGQDEHSDPPCWGNDSLDAVLAAAGKRHMKVMLDIAFNHFGHNYQMYDYGNYTPVQDWMDMGRDYNSMYNEDNPPAGFDAFYEDGLKEPVLLDTEAELTDLKGKDVGAKRAVDAIALACQIQNKPMLTGNALVRAYHMWRNGLKWERDGFQCQDTFLEFQDPGFYLGQNAWDPSRVLGDNFTNNWTDVKFLYHHQENPSHEQEFVRDREYLFRILNYWVYRGVAGFRFDHSTDPEGGMGPDEWKYILSKVDYYAQKRGQDKPIYLAEEFGDQMGMSHVVDIMTDGYIGNMKGGNPKDARFVEQVMENNRRFNGHTLVMTALEDHDEPRLVDPNAGQFGDTGDGFNHWTGAGFWGAGATVWSTPMILVGQEFGETYGLGFKRNDFIRARFPGTSNYIGDGDFYPLINYYGMMIKGRLADENRALRADQDHYFYLPLKENPAGTPDARIFAQARWTDDGNVVFTFQSLWPDPNGYDIAQHYYIPAYYIPKMHIDADVGSQTHYRLCDILGVDKGTDNCALVRDCISGSKLAWDFAVVLPASTRAQWLRLEQTKSFCPPDSQN